MTDLPLYLPEGIYLRSLVIDPEFSVISETMQRAVSLVVLSDDDRLKVNGSSAIELFQQSTSAGAESIVRMLNGVTNYLTFLLNAGDGLNGGQEKLVASTAFSVNVEGTTVKITLDITMVKDNETESTVVYSYE